MTTRADRSAIPDAPPARPQLGDAAVVALASSVWLGARLAVTVPLAVAAGLVAGAWAARRPWALVVACGLLAASLGARALDGLADPPAGPVDAVVTLVADPRLGDFGVSAEVRVEGRRALLEADGGRAGALAAARMGEQVRVVGRWRAAGPPPGWMVARHLVGRIDARTVDRVGAGAAPHRAANRIRGLVERSATGLPRDERALYLGFVLGDDRDQSAALVDDFRGTGLSHLMVVSGQNLAFALALAGPVLRRVGWTARWGLTVGVVAGFALLTRFEPSVLRAAAMAVVAVSGQLVGRPSPAWRTLALAVAAMILVDPVLTRSTGFQLSVAATGAIAVLGPPLASALPGPRPLADAIATAAAAQVGVTPILLGFAGGAPVVSVAANVLAGPAAALVTTYGLPAGVVGGLLGGPVARWLHGPSVAAIGWVALIARTGARLPLGELGLPSLGALVVTGTLAARWARLRAPAALVALAVVLAPALALHRPPAHVRTAAGCEVWRADGATVVEVPERARVEDVLRDLRRAGVRRIDLLVGQPDAELLGALRHRWPVARVQQADPSAGMATTVGGDAGAAAAGSP